MYGAGPASSARANRNLGIPFYEIPVAVRQLLDDTKAWIEYKSYPPDEIAVRFHHRLVQIISRASATIFSVRSVMLWRPVPQTDPG